MQYKAQIYVTLRPSVLDPAGTAVQSALRQMNYQVDSLRIGKYIELELTAADAAQAETQLHKICREVLANPVTEVYSFELTPVSCG
jgi:phosphoribosylformylglycinamidine synthase PurS subunit